jgi:hypothetical protein
VLATTCTGSQSGPISCTCSVNGSVVQQCTHPVNNCAVNSDGGQTRVACCVY